MVADIARREEMLEVLKAQKVAFIKEGIPSFKVRADRIDRAIALLVEHQKALCDALADDYGHRSKDQTALTDIMTPITALKHTRAHMEKWMKPERRGVTFPLGLLGARGEIRRTPKGSIGIVAPWNFPINLTFGPLACILGAGNRATIKPSEFTEATSALIAKLCAQYFDPTEIAVFAGGPEVGAAFSSLPHDHLIFTGATSIARHVMRAAADNLVPLTLELGGKSPVILGQSADMEKAAKRIMATKLMNAGQICVAPDYILAPAAKIGSFVDHARAAVAKFYPTLKDNDDYTSIANQRHYDRLQGYLEDAKAKGAQLVEINPANENFDQQPHHKMAPVLVLNPTDDMAVMQDEIFGPILPIKSYETADEAIAYVNAGERPLALYHFGTDRAETDKVINSTMSGGVTVNDTLFHQAQEDLPFGGTGASGMGYYHGIDGFNEFSHRKSVMTQTGNETVLGILRPPYGNMFKKQVASRIKK